MSWMLLIFSCAFAAKLEDKYVMKTFENGQLYFVVPYDIPSRTAKQKALSADITYKTTSNMVTMNLSVWTDEELLTDSIVLVGHERLNITDFQTFFIEKDRKLWLHRYSLQFPWKYFNLMYADPNPFSINIYSVSRNLQFGFSDKQWHKEQDWMNQILHIIASNKRLYKQK
jgi:hypothetical protein